jgi:hypothetical protein
VAAGTFHRDRLFLADEQCLLFQSWGRDCKWDCKHAPGLLCKLFAPGGDTLTRREVMNQASHLNMEIPMLLPGIKVTLSPTDYRVMKQLQLERFDGEQRRLFGGVIEASAR